MRVDLGNRSTLSVVPLSSIFERIRIVLVSTRNPLNIGAVARAMSNFGFSQLRVVHPYDAAFREARSAVGAEELLAHAEQYDSVADAVADCTLVVGTAALAHRELRHTLLPLKDGARLILAEASSASTPRGSVAILFGSEKRGLSNHDLSHCHGWMHIPTREQQPSVNLGQAVAICLYELARESPAPEIALTTGSPATAEELERLTQLLLSTLHSSGYIPSKPTQTQEEAIRRMVRRLEVPAADVAGWLGIYRQILWKLKSKE